jgi:integrase/recombinase XerD
MLSEGKYRSLSALKDESDFIKADMTLIFEFLFHNNSRRVDELNKDSLRGYMNDLEMFVSYLRSLTPICSLANVGYVELTGYDKWLKNRKVQGRVYSPVTVRRKLTMVRALLKFGFDFDFYDRDLSSYLKLPKIKHVRQERKLNKKEMQLLMDELKKKPLNRIIGSILLMMGLRISELCDARWGHIYEGINAGVFIKVIGKGDKERHLKMDPNVFQLILRYRAARGECIVIGKKPDEYLLTNSKGHKLIDRGVRDIIARAVKRADIEKKVSPHWFRHSTASYALIGGASIQQVKEMLGHTDIRTTQAYLHDIELEMGKSASDYIEGINI